MKNRSSLRTARFSPRGFTFAEILAAMLFMAIVVPVTVQGVMIANRAGVVSQRKRQAAELAERCLSEQIVTELWRDKTKQDGDFGDDWPDFKWTMTSEAWDQDDTMQTVTVEVTFKVQGQEYRVALSTLAPTEQATQ
jgi:hypothetical protein